MANQKIEGVTEVIQFCAKIGETAAPDILRPILDRGAEIYAAEVRKETPSDTGAMAKSVHAVLATNPRVARAYATFDIEHAIKERNRVRVARKHAPVENDARYVFIVMAGSGPHQIKARKAKTLLLSSGGHRDEVNHPGTKANPVMDRAFRQAKDRVVSQVTKEIADEFLKLKAQYNA